MRFANKEQSLRDDVRTLGTMVGDLIREQGGEELFEFVETARRRSIRRREGNELPGEELAELVENLDPDLALQVIRSFSTYFQMVNTAEKVHRIRRRREYLRDVGQYQPGGFEDMLMRLKAAGVDTNINGTHIDGITGKCLVMVTPDAERTMQTFLGAMNDIKRGEPERISDATSASLRSSPVIRRADPRSV